MDKAEHLLHVAEQEINKGTGTEFASAATTVAMGYMRLAEMVPS